MKIRKGFVLRPTLGYTVVVATGELASQFKGMIKLNQTGADIWGWIDEGLDRSEVVSRIMENYPVDERTASGDYDAFVSKMLDAGVFEQ